MSSPLVSIGLPVRNGQGSIERAVRSVLGQDHAELELLISDNASDDGTEEICRQLAASDERVRYLRQPTNIGLQRNFLDVLRRATGPYFRWLGADDWLEPAYTTRCLGAFADDPRLIMVTTQQAYVHDDGRSQTEAYTGGALGSDRAHDRFVEMLRLLNESYLLIDPVYGLVRRPLLVSMPRPLMLYEDEILAARLALAGPIRHLPELLANRGFRDFARLPQVAARLGVPPWQARVALVRECQELARLAWNAPLTPPERRSALRAVGRLYGRRQLRRARNGGRRVLNRFVPRPGIS